MLKIIKKSEYQELLDYKEKYEEIIDYYEEKNIKLRKQLESSGQLNQELLEKSLFDKVIRENSRPHCGMSFERCYQKMKYYKIKTNKLQVKIDKAIRIYEECKMLMPHEFDWQEQFENVINILKGVEQ